MSDYEKLQTLQDRLRELELRIPTECNRSILEVARTAIEEQITGLGRRMVARNYWRPSVHGLRQAS